MARKLVVCLDGTGNEIETNESNILRLYKCLHPSENQLVYYETGVGTLSTRRFAKGVFSKPTQILGMVTGRGLEATVLHAYRFLCNNYQTGDQLFFFGYSRGAYAARVLAGFINDFGLVSPHELHLIGPVFRTYRKLSETDPRTKHAPLRMYQNFFDVIHPPIRFLGLWDTVSSLLRIKPGQGTVVQYGTHSSVNENPSVAAVRHVLALDETRRFFRHQLWAPNQTFWGNRFKMGKGRPQDVKQVWFSGTHTDVAGSIPEADAGLAKITLTWMRKELDGLGTDAPDFREDIYARFVSAIPDDISQSLPVTISAPDATAKSTNKLWQGWFVLEPFPRLRRRSRWPHLRGRRGYYIPWAQARYVEPDAEIHQTVWQRHAAVNDYRPNNLKDHTPPKDA